MFPLMAFISSEHWIRDIHPCLSPWQQIRFFQGKKLAPKNCPKWQISRAKNRLLKIALILWPVGPLLCRRGALALSFELQGSCRNSQLELSAGRISTRCPRPSVPFPWRSPEKIEENLGLFPHPKTTGVGKKGFESSSCSRAAVWAWLQLQRDCRDLLGSAAGICQDQALLLPALHTPAGQAQPRAWLLLRTAQHPRPDHGDQTPPKKSTFSSPAQVPATSSLQARIKYRIYKKIFFTSFSFY